MSARSPLDTDRFRRRQFPNRLKYGVLIAFVKVLWPMGDGFNAPIKVP